MSRTYPLSFFLLLLAQSCTTVSAPPAIKSELRGYSQHVFRGVSQTDGKALQALHEWTVDLGEGQRFSFGTFFNADGSNNSGDGVFPDGNGGQITRVEFEPTWTWELADSTFSVGLVNRSHPNISGLGDTTESVLAWTPSFQLWDFQPRFRVYYDLEDGDGMYTQLGLSREYVLGANWNLETSIDMSHVDRDQAEVLYMVDSPGFGDLTGQAVLSWERSPNLDIIGTIAASTIVSNRLADSIELNGHDDANLWLGLGMSWEF